MTQQREWNFLTGLPKLPEEMRLTNAFFASWTGQ